MHPELFKVDRRRRPLFLAGSPPDSFSAEGQLFNCAVYDWDALKKDRFNWWIRRFRYLFNFFDCVRVDHFRGLISYWEIPAGEKNARNGSWQPAPVRELIDALLLHYPDLPVIAEGLGVITAEVREAMGSYGIPGIRVLLLAFQKGACKSSYLPHNHIKNCVVYTGTHDTNSIMGWFHGKESREDRERLFSYLGRRVEREANWELIRMAMMSVAQTAVVQMQDVLGEGGESRMNTPGKAEGNWQWRIPAVDLAPYASRLAEMATTYGRGR